jgi:hypothetical protein
LPVISIRVEGGAERADFASAFAFMSLQKSAFPQNAFIVDNYN